MLKLAKFDNNSFSDDLVKKIITDKKTVVSEIDVDRTSQYEKALNLSKVYWMTGWSWDEIENILFDLEYPENVIGKVIKETKEYAREKMENGPFSILKKGQLVKLKNRIVAELVSISDKSARMVNSDNGEFTANTDQIDIESTLKLTEAFKLREAAKELLRSIAQEKYDVPKRTEDVPESKIDEYVFSELPFAPPGMADTAPDRGEAISVNKKLTESLATLDGLSKTKEELEEKMANIRDNYLNPIRDQIKDLDTKAQESVRKLYAILNEIGQGVSETDDAVFRDYNGKLIALKKELDVIQNPPSPDAELDALKNILRMNHPEIIDKVSVALKKWKEKVSSVEKIVKNRLYLFPYRKTPKDEQSDFITKKESLEIRNINDELSDFINSRVRNHAATLNKILRVVKLHKMSNAVDAAVKVYSRR